MDRPKVGIGVIIKKGNEILLGQRTNAHGSGDWCFPGGHLEYGESWEACARRETLEETGLELSEISFLTATNDIFAEEGKHYITLFMIADHPGGEPDCLEPEKCEGWEWFAWDDMPENVFLPIRNLKKQDLSFLT